MANPVIKGLHHITLCAAGAQEDVDFCTQVLGQRLIKQTVLFDGRYAHYHLYYANANAEVGSVLTTFPYKRVPGRQGSGQISSTAYTAPKGAIKFWKEHLDRHKVEHSGILERFGQSFIRFKHPSGLLMEVIEDPADKRTGWTTDQISGDVSLGGFHGPVLSVREIPEQERFFIEALGFRKTGAEGAYHRFEVGDGGAAKTLVLYHEPDRAAGAGDSARAPGIIWRSTSAPTKRSRNRRISTRNWATPTARKSRIATTSTRSTCGLLAGILTECAATAEGASCRTNRTRSSARTCCCRPGSSTSAQGSSRCSSRSSCRRPIGRRRAPRFRRRRSPPPRRRIPRSRVTANRRDLHRKGCVTVANHLVIWSSGFLVIDWRIESVNQ